VEASLGATHTGAALRLVIGSPTPGGGNSNRALHSEKQMFLDVEKDPFHGDVHSKVPVSKRGSTE